MSSITFFQDLLVLVLGAGILFVIANRLGMPSAVTLLLGGAGLGFISQFPVLRIEPEVVLVVLIPPLLMQSAYSTAWREFKKELPAIVSLAVGSVIFTSVAVACAAHWAVPELPWAACFALGGIVSPPDAVAAKALLHRLPLPERLVVILEGESLINDASGLVIYRFAVLAAMANTFSASNALITFPTLIVVGVIVGALCGWFATWLFKWLDNVELTIVLTFLVSWASYICSESVHGSGVLAVVACGLVIGLRQHKVFDAEVRVKATATWGVLVFVLESLVFILIGLALRGAVVQMESHAGSDMSLALGWRMAGIVLAAVIVSRLVWVFGAMALPAWLFAKSTGSARRADFKGSALLGWAGMRGVVSLAAALALPESFPQRDLLIFTTFIVIFATVVFQGMTLGPLSKWLRLERSPAGARNKRLMSQFQARAHTFQASVDALRQIDLLHCGGNADLVGRLIDEYQIRAESNEAAHTGELAHLERRSGRLELGLKAVAAARGALVELHEQHRIRDDVLHRIEGELDLEEMRLRYLLAPSD